MAEEDLEAWRRKRLAEIQARQRQDAYDQAAAQVQAQAEAAELEAQREELLRRILTPEARDRLARLRLARPEDARALEGQLIQLAQSGRLTAQIDDEQLKQILARLFPGGRDISIRRK